MTQFWKAQEKILAEMEGYAKHWFARRHEAARSALGACERAAGASPEDAADAAGAVREWQAHSVERTAEDMREWVDLWARCAGHLFRADVGAGAETLEGLRRETAELQSHHATPV